MTSLHDLIIKINNSLPDIHFDKIEGFSCVGDVRSDSHIHPIQYRAISNILPGMDDPFEGIGWTPTQAVRNLLKDIQIQPELEQQLEEWSDLWETESNSQQELLSTSS